MCMCYRDIGKMHSTVPQEVQSSCKGPEKWPQERIPSPLWVSTGLSLALLLDVVCTSLERGPTCIAVACGVSIMTI